MNQEQIGTQIGAEIHVTRQMVTLAKAFLQAIPGFGPHRPIALSQDFASHNGFPMPEILVIQDGDNADARIRDVARHISHMVAMAEAVWSLIHGGFLVAPNHQIEKMNLTLKFHHIAGSGSSTGGLDLSQWEFELPQLIAVAPSLRSEDCIQVVDGDLFALESGLGDALPEVIEACDDAVLCLQRDLYRPATVMLGKAAEGAWIEAGRSLAGATLDRSKGAKFVDQMGSNDRGLPWKMGRVVDLYRQTAKESGIERESGIGPRELDSAVIWTNVVWNARKAVHFESDTPIENSYERTAVLFLEGSTILRRLYRVKAHAEKAAIERKSVQ